MGKAGPKKKIQEQKVILISCTTICWKQPGFRLWHDSFILLDRDVMWSHITIQISLKPGPSDFGVSLGSREAHPKNKVLVCHSGLCV
jgi:hypothetical protein